jgi:hypothetical protein
MLDFSFADPRLLFPNITEAFAHILENISTAWYFISLALIVIGEWKLFRKLGEKPWKSIVPFYNTYIMYKCTWKKSAFWIYILSSVVFNIAQNASKSLAQRFPTSNWMTLILLIALPFGIIAAVCSILYALRIAEAFGKGKIFCVGLLVIYPIFIAILGFGRSRYVGPFSEAKAQNVTEEAQSKLEVV